MITDDSGRVLWTDSPAPAGMREVDTIFQDTVPGWLRLLPAGRRFEIGAGNLWVDRYHHVGRPVYTDATNAEIREARRADFFRSKREWEDDEIAMHEAWLTETYPDERAAPSPPGRKAHDERR